MPYSVAKLARSIRRLRRACSQLRTPGVDVPDSFGPWAHKCPLIVQPEAERCPHCPGVKVVYCRQESWAGPPVPQQGEQLPAPCAVCGRPAEVLAVVEDPYFFRRHD
jgi:hypothetical protein